MPAGNVVRIIDANLNRAREALRVLEDSARFLLGDAELAGSCKRLRDDLRAAILTLNLDPLQLAASRDTPGDVGTALTSPGESQRQGPAGVAIAAGKRLGEALRTIEEYAKVLASPDHNPGPAVIKRLRYEAYDVERRLTLALGGAVGGGRSLQWTLCVLISQDLCRAHPWERVAELALEGGADCLQLREKTLDGRELVRRAALLVGLARARASVIVNDRADVALAAGAHGVHLGHTDLTVPDVRRIAGARLLVGVSTSNLTQARDAARDGADYCGVGPMFATTTKHKPVLSGPAYLRDYLADPAASRLPHLAIGGVNESNIDQLAAAGCRGVAVSAAVCGADDPRRVCQELVRRLRTPTTPAPG